MKLRFILSNLIFFELIVNFSSKIDDKNSNGYLNKIKLRTQKKSST